MLKQPTQLLGSLYSNSPTSDETESFENTLSERRAAKVWLRLREMHGDRFLREFGSQPNETWRAAIDRLSDDEIRQALKTLAEKGSPHPPTLGEFVAACRPPKPETGSPRYLGANPINYTEMRIAGLLPQAEKKVHDVDALRKALRS